MDLLVPSKSCWPGNGVSTISGTTILHSDTVSSLILEQGLLGKLLAVSSSLYLRKLSKSALHVPPALNFSCSSVLGPHSIGECNEKGE